MPDTKIVVIGAGSVSFGTGTLCDLFALYICGRENLATKSVNSPKTTAEFYNVTSFKIQLLHLVKG